MAEDSAASRLSRKEFDQLAVFGVLETAAVPSDLLGAGTTFETEQSTSGRPKVHGRREIYYPKHEKSQCDLKTIISYVARQDIVTWTYQSM